MSSVAQFQFIEFILLLVLTHLTIKMIVPKLDIPFLGLSSASVLNAILFIFCPGNRTIWIVLNLLTLALIFYLKRINLCQVAKAPKLLSLSLIAWPIALFVTAFLLSTTLAFSPINTRPEAGMSSSRDKLMVQLFQGEDNFTHINLVQAINKTGNSTYFSSTKDWNYKLLPTVSSYPQLEHLATSNIKVAIHDINSIMNRPNPDITSALWSYVLTHFFMMGMAIGLSASILFSILRKYLPMKDKYALTVSILFTVVAMKYLMFQIISWGFFSQSAGLIGIFLAFIIETDPDLILNKNEKQIRIALLRTIPIIIVGQTWSPLFLVLIPFIFAQLVPEYFSALKSKTLKSTILPTFVLLCGSIFALLPTFILLFAYDSDPLNIAKLAGGIQHIDIVKILIYLSLFMIISFSLIFCISKAERNLYRSIFYFTASSCFALLTISLYQKISSNSFSYYSYKMAWSVAWIPLIGIFIFIGHLFFRLINSGFKIGFIKSSSLMTFAISLTVAFCAYNLVKISSIQALSFSRGTNSIQLADLAQAIEKADNQDKTLIVISDCAGNLDYNLQKAASTIQARWTPETFEYTRNLIIGKEKDKARHDLLVANKEIYNVLDLTPLIDENPPSKRLKIDDLSIDRTRLYSAWETEKFTSQCQNEVISNTPEIEN